MRWHSSKTSRSEQIEWVDQLNRTHTWWPITSWNIIPLTMSYSGKERERERIWLGFFLLSFSFSFPSALKWTSCTWIWELSKRIRRIPMTKWTAETAAAASLPLSLSLSLYLSASQVNPMICQNHVSLSVTAAAMAGSTCRLSIIGERQKFEVLREQNTTHPHPHPIHIHIQQSEREREESRDPVSIETTAV